MGRRQTGETCPAGPVPPITTGDLQTEGLDGRAPTVQLLQDDATTKPPVLAAQDVTFTYPDGTVALHDLTLSLPEGSRVVILGVNGCGKTTLFLNFNGILRPTEGAISISGEPLRYGRQALRELRRRVGLVFQDPDTQLFAASVRQDISFGPLNLGWPKEDVRAKVEQVIEDTGLTELADRPTHLLSHGQKKRVAIAGVLVMEPEVIIADEPTAGLDPEMTRRLLDLLDALHRGGRTIAISTHDVELALAWSDHVVVMSQGQVLAQGHPVAVLTDDVLLREARLLQPILVSVYRQLSDAGILPQSAAVPRTASDLAALLARHTGPHASGAD
ncbi:MAG: energy-coupling factor ABC transporter ATP-binding protein [Dehalococcoidia bacterium]|nr:energy-coupling factor ABC transporter ATP-binding protein [Dehalococcoidia bacterium]